MRKYFALMMVALLALTLSVAMVGCAKQSSTESTPPPAATPAPETTMPDTAMMADTSMGGGH
jgi:hypothetical protein